MSIRWRLLLTLIPILLLLFGGGIFISFHSASGVVAKQIRQQVDSLVASHVDEFQAMAETAARVAGTMADAVSVGGAPDDSAIRNLLKLILSQNQALYGATLALAPGATPLGVYASYYYRAPDGSLAYKSLAGPAYDYQRWEWFAEPMRTGRGQWMEPYEDRGGGEALMTTYATPISRNGRKLGVAAVDLRLDDLVRKVRSVRVGESGYAYIVSKGGRFVAHPKKKLLTSDSIWESGANSPNPRVVELVRMLRSGRPMFTRMSCPFTGKDSFIITVPIPSTEWVMAVHYPSDEVLAPLNRLRAINLIIAFAGLVLLALVIVLVSSTATAPLQTLVTQAEQYAAGNLKGRLDEKRGMREIRRLSSAFNTMGAALDRKMEDLRSTQLEIVLRLGRAAEYRDADTGLHIRRTCHYAALMAQLAGLKEEECEYIFLAMPMHDIGKIGIPDAILLKPGKLTPEEITVMRTHPRVGADILSGSSSKLLQVAQVVALTHHEAWDGSGYPGGLKGDSIPIAGRIAALSDVLDALTSERPYKKSWSMDDAMREISRKSGTQFDPRLVEILTQHRRQFEEVHDIFAA